MKKVKLNKDFEINLKYIKKDEQLIIDLGIGRKRNHIPIEDLNDLIECLIDDLVDYDFTQVADEELKEKWITYN